MEKEKYITISNELLQKRIDEKTIDCCALLELQRRREADEEEGKAKARALTLEEVFELDDKPAWIQVLRCGKSLIGINNSWAVLGVICNEVIIWQFGCSTPDYLYLQDYGETWCAFTDRPESDK